MTALSREFDRRGLGYVLRVPDVVTELSVDRLSRSRGEVHGELVVECGLPGTRSLDGHLHQARFNLSSTTSRTTLARVLTARSNAPELDWLDLLEDLCRRVLSAERRGDPVEKVGALPIPLGEVYRLEPMLPKGSTTFLYGREGTGKSTLACAIAVSVETGSPMVHGWTPHRARTLFLDWEGGRASINRRVRGIAIGAGLPDVVTIDYLDCRRRGPLHGFAEDIARMVDAEGYGLVVVDSVGMAAGTSNEGSDANESALRLFGAFGYIGTTVLAIDHVSHAEAEVETRQARPYGSRYKGALARAMWEIRRTRAPDGRSVIGLYHTKANDADLQPPSSLAMTYGPDGSIRYDRLSDLPADLTKPLRLADRIAAALGSDRLSVKDIAFAIGEDEDKVRTTLNRDKARFARLPSGAWELLPAHKTASAAEPAA